PDSAEVQQQSDERPGRDGLPREGWRQRLTGLLKGRRRAPAAPVVEEHPYRTAECPINEELIARLHDLTRSAQEQAIEQAWSLDWTLLAGLRRQEADARDAKNAWVSLRKLGEILYLLGQAARFHGKSVAAPDVH